MTTIDLQIHSSLQSSIDPSSAIEDANNGIGKDDERWRMLWHEPMQGEHLASIRLLVEKLKPQCENILLLGIGGSALGTKALHTALRSDGPRLFVLDNIDPHTVQTTIDTIMLDDPTLEHTVVTVISKSGETAEITSLLMVVEQAMGEATFVAITGPSGTLREYASKKKWATLTVPDGVGGRFSVLSPVGLFPAAMCGIDIEELLRGAREMDARCQQTENNPAGRLSASLVGAMQEDKPIHVMMPYCDRMENFARWYVQLWAESLGKINKKGVRIGPTPVAAIGATDQHSMLQLWREGPTDKVIGFVSVSEMDAVPLGKAAISDSQEWLCGETLGSLLHAQQKATEKAMQEAAQATWTITLDQIDAFAVGEFIALWQATVAIAGRLLGVNPYNQPGVELGKQLTRDAISKK
jgi:glucose-6-phosphate isomerase